MFAWNRRKPLKLHIAGTRRRLVLISRLRGIRQRSERRKMRATSHRHENITHCKHRVGRRIEHHVSRRLLDRDDDDMMVRHEPRLAQRTPGERAAFADPGFFQLQFDMFRSSRQAQ